MLHILAEWNFQALFFVQSNSENNFLFTSFQLFIYSISE